MVPDAIRPAEAADGPRAVAALGEWMPAAQARRLAPQLRPADGSEIAYVADGPGGSLAGFIIAVLPDQGVGPGYVHFVWVDPAARGAGLGRALYATVLDELRRQGCADVLAVVAERNRGARRFHERLGFHEAVGTGLEVRDTPAGPGVVMARRL